MDKLKHLLVVVEAGKPRAGFFSEYAKAREAFNTAKLAGREAQLYANLSPVKRCKAKANDAKPTK